MIDKNSPRQVRPRGEPAACVWDVIVIGGGVVGCAVLRELSRFALEVLLLEKEADLAEGISKANSGVIHSGFNVPSGTLKARTNVEGLRKIYSLAAELDVPCRRTGKLVVALSESERPRLEELKAQGERNGTPDLRIVPEAEIPRIEPRARGCWALYSPHTGIISPYEFTYGLAECAWKNGAEVRLGSPVESVSFDGDLFIVETPQGANKSRWVVNGAGLSADTVARLAGLSPPRIYPYRGEYLVTDRNSDIRLGLPLYPVPPAGDTGLGIHITPTMEGNILLGPSADFVEDKTDTASTAPVMERLKKEAARLMPELRNARFIQSYSGNRPKLAGPDGGGVFRDFVIEESPRRPRWINLFGIESPGLTASPAIAEMVSGLIAKREPLRPKGNFDRGRPTSSRFAVLDDDARRARVNSHPDWGEMVCRCEHVTKAEVTAALRNPFGARTLDAIKRRTRCGMGRCQGGFCTPRLVEILEEEGTPLEMIAKRGDGSRLFYGRIKS